MKIWKLQNLKMVKLGIQRPLFNSMVDWTGLGGLKVRFLTPIKVKSMDKIYSKVLENDFDVSYDEFVQYLRLIFKLMTARGRFFI